MNGTDIIKVTLPEYAAKYNPVKNRRDKPMSWGYLYRLIRQDMEGTNTRPLWFKYELEGPKDKIWIIVHS